MNSFAALLSAFSSMENNALLEETRRASYSFGLLNFSISWHREFTKLSNVSRACLSLKISRSSGTMKTKLIM